MISSEQCFTSLTAVHKLDGGLQQPHLDSYDVAVQWLITCGFLHTHV